MDLPRYARRSAGMNRERWQQIKQLLEEVIALDDGERPSFLDRVCQGDAELRRELESLLSSHRQAESGFLQQPVVKLSGQTAAAAAATPARERRGRKNGAHPNLGKIWARRGGRGDSARPPPGPTPTANSPHT